MVIENMNFASKISVDEIEAMCAAALTTEDFDNLILKKIPGYSRYLASNQGFIIKVSGERRFSPEIKYGNRSKGDKYMRLAAYSDMNEEYRTTYIHRLVALAFHGIPDSSETDVHHIDGNPRNNRPENLMWCTHQANCQQTQHAGRQGKAILQIDLQTNKVIAQWVSVLAAARSVGKGSSHALGNALLRNGGQCVLYGYIWRYSQSSNQILE